MWVLSDDGRYLINLNQVVAVEKRFESNQTVVCLYARTDPTNETSFKLMSRNNSTRAEAEVENQMRDIMDGLRQGAVLIEIEKDPTA